MRFLFLYTEIADYFLACCQELSPYGEVHIVRWPVNQEAPFHFSFPDQLRIYDKNRYTPVELAELIRQINPSVIICSGWIDKDYLKVTRSWYGKIPTVMTCDTHWRGDLKQRVATLLGRFYLRRIFSHAWVPGKIQRDYVIRLGFNANQIETGFYSCNLSYFDAVYKEQMPDKMRMFPKRFVFAGRYYEFKGIKELWQAFIELQNESPNSWELWCLGVGDVEAAVHPRIRHFGFVQPAELRNITAQTGVFILPSRFEPWGVVVHEFAASGFPLLLSNRVGAKEQFLREPDNGFSFEAEQVSGIKAAMKRMIQMPDEALIRMAEQSYRLAQTVTPKTWIASLLKIVKTHA